MLLRLFILLISLPVGATVFQLHSIDQQIAEADGIFLGHYLRSESVQLEQGQIATQMIFKIKKEVGLQSDLFGMDEVIIHYPGGQIGDTISKVEGVPHFVTGEKVAIFVKSHQNRYWGMNLGLGTFKVINYGNEKMLVNTLFPQDRRVGQIKLENFERKIRDIKNSSLKVVLKPANPSELDENDQPRLPASDKEEGKIRSIASEGEEGENDLNHTSFSSTWLIFILAALGGLFRLSRQREAK